MNDVVWCGGGVMVCRTLAFRNTYVNLALPLFTFSDPFAPATTEVELKTGKWKWSLWDRIDINEQKDITLDQFLKLFTVRVVSTTPDRRHTHAAAGDVSLIAV
jgi:hypothetical protein